MATFVMAGGVSFLAGIHILSADRVVKQQLKDITTIEPSCPTDEADVKYQTEEGTISITRL